MIHIKKYKPWIFYPSALCDSYPENPANKIISGDKSDNISPVFKKCNHSTILKYYNDKTLFEEQLRLQGCEEIYKRNKKLVDFNEIPEDLVLEFMTNITNLYI